MNTAWDYTLFQDREIREQFQSVTSPDPAFGALATFYDEKTVLSHLAAPLMQHQSLHIDCFTVLSVRHIFGKRFQVVYQVGSRRDPNQSLILSVRFFQSSRDAALAPENGASSAAKSDLIDLPEWSAVVSIFPEDAALPALRRMIEPETAAQSLARHCGLTVDQGEIAWRLFAYHPGERATLQHRFDDTLLIGKTTRDRSVIKAHQQMIALWHCPERAFRMPRPLRLDPEAGIRWESFLSGKRIEALFSEITWTRFLEGVCRALVNLHRLHIEALPSNDMNTVLQRMRKKMIPRMCESLFPLSQEIHAYFDCLEEKGRSLPERTPVTIHGDLHTGNILIDGDEIAFIDLDGLSMGDPAYDLALLGSRLLMLALVKKERVKEVADAVALLPDAYQSAGGAPIPEAVFAWYLAALLVGRQLKTCVRERAPGLGRLAPCFIGLSRALLETGEVQESFARQLYSRPSREQ